MRKIEINPRWEKAKFEEQFVPATPIPKEYKGLPLHQFPDGMARRFDKAEDALSRKNPVPFYLVTEDDGTQLETF